MINKPHIGDYIALYTKLKRGSGVHCGRVQNALRLYMWEAPPLRQLKEALDFGSEFFLDRSFNLHDELQLILETGVSL